jgi:hypothetical protein
MKKFFDRKENRRTGTEDKQTVGDDLALSPRESGRSQKVSLSFGEGRNRGLS